MALSPVALTDTFDVWRTRTNQIIVLAEQTESNLSSIGVSVNAYANSVGTSGNAYATAVGTSGNAFATSVGTSGNTYATAVGTSGNAYATAIGTSGNAYATAVGAAGNTYTLAAFDKANTTTYTSNLVISVADNINAALRITQTGTAPAIRVEDSANPDSTPFIVDATGNVGIGLQTPLYKLDVRGTTDLDSSIRAVNNGTETSNLATVVVATGSSVQGSITAQGNQNVLVGTDTNHPLVLRTNATERVRVDLTGNVLVGRTTSTVGNNVKLDVNGAINASAVLVNGNEAVTTGKAIAMAIVFG